MDLIFKSLQKKFSKNIYYYEEFKNATTLVEPTWKRGAA